jgi:kynureninase
MISDQGQLKAQQLDATDPLKSFREHFVIDDPDVIYLDGNSLGRLPVKTAQHIEQVLHKEWGKDLIEGWNKVWYGKSRHLGDKIARIIGAQPGEVIVADNTSTNLYKLVWASLQLQPERHTILSDDLNFPSDLYILQGLADNAARPVTIQLVKSDDGIHVRKEAISSKLNRQVALLTLSHVAFKSSFMHDMKGITELAHKVGARVLWDLSHSTGAVPLNLGDAGVDMAVGCTYKYLNAGPGAPAFLYVRKDLQHKLISPIQGWFGADQPFQFGLEYRPAMDISRFLSGTPPILSVAGIEFGLDLILEAGMESIREKSVKMSAFLVELFQKELLPLGFSLASPAHVEQRGSHVSIAHKEARRISLALADKTIGNVKVIPDFRAPHLLRFGLASLYNSYEDIWRAMHKLKKIAGKQLFEDYRVVENPVT